MADDRARVKAGRTIGYPWRVTFDPGEAFLQTTIYKISPRALWRDAEAAGIFAGAPVDHTDGFIHFSTAAQLAETAAKHFAGQSDLLLVGADAARLGEALRWEPSRGGALFPHLYGALELAAVTRVEPLPLGPDGRHCFPVLAG